MILAPGTLIDAAYLPEEIRDYEPPAAVAETPFYTDALPTVSNLSRFVNWRIVTFTRC